MFVPQYVVIGVRVTPGARRDEVIGWSGDDLRIRLRAQPEGGRANEALRRLLAERLDIPRSDVEIVAGATSRRKRLRIAGVPEQELTRRLSGG
jgi:uncharacterized protein (TIGR00251 family)